MRLGSLAYRFLRSTLAISAVSVAILAAFTFRFWPEPLLRETFLHVFPSNLCVGCDPDLLALNVASSLLIGVSYFLLAGTFIYLYVDCGKLLPLRGLALFVAAFAAVCGLTRALELASIWHPGGSEATKMRLATAVLGVIFAGLAPRVVPRVREFLQSAQRSERTEAHFIAAAESSLDAFYLLRSVRDEDGQISDFRFTYLNHNGEDLIGLPRKQILGADLCVLIPINRSGGFFDDYKRVVMSGEPAVHEFPIQLSDGTPRWIRHQVVRLEDGIAITASDITERKQSEQLAQHRAHHDILTGLPNRSLLDDRIQQAIDRADRYKQKVALFVVDLDEFKEINDTLGHTAGDLVLVTVAQRLRESVRATDSVLRIGGDEFIVVMPDVVEDRDILRSAAKLLANLSREGPPGAEAIMLSCSVGISIYPSLARSRDELINRADAAMYQAKARGGGCYELFNRETPGFYPHLAPQLIKGRGARPMLVAPRSQSGQTIFPLK